MAAPPDERFPQQRLWDAAMAGDCAGIAAALDAGADIEGAQQLFAGPPSSSLGLAVRSNHLDAVQLLLGRGASVRPLPPVTPPLSELMWRWPPGLQQAGDALAIARALLAAGANANAVGISIITPLSNAARCGCLAGVRLLLAAGADVSAAPIAGISPLHRAAYSSSEWPDPAGCIGALLAAGADARAVTFAGLTPLHCVGSNLHPDHTAAAARLLVAAGADVDARDEYGVTPLALAARSGLAPVEFALFGCARVARALLAVGADPAAAAFWRLPNIAALPRAAKAELMWEAAWARRGALRMLRRRLNPNSDERNADEAAAAAAATAAGTGFAAAGAGGSAAPAADASSAGGE
jgi:ankyrin repeat protein